MIRELSSKVLEFGGPTTHTRCFLHTVNLVAKSLIREFDVKKPEADQALLAHDDVDSELEELSAEMDEEAGVTDEVDNDDGLVDEVELLDEKEQVALNKEIRPVKLALVKVSAQQKKTHRSQLMPQVRKLAYKIIHSTTIVLPAWYGILKDLSKPQTLMPRDVSTRWNSTFDMLDYALEHREAVDAVTQRRDLGLRRYELEDNEWVILQQLRDILKVRRPFPTHALLSWGTAAVHVLLIFIVCCLHLIDSKGRHTLLLARNTQPCDSDSSNGLRRQDAHHLFTQQEISALNSFVRSAGQKYTQPVLSAYGQVSHISNLNGYVCSIFTGFVLLTVVLVLHPQHKLSYFKGAQWEDDWIETAEQLVREEFERSYLSVNVNSDLECEEDVSESNGDISMVFFYLLFTWCSY